MIKWLTKRTAEAKETFARVKVNRVIRQQERAVLAKYDAAQTSRENTRHWSMADSLSASAATNAEVRRIVRNRSRYETANNSYLAGMLGTLADYIIGTGPRLQLLSNSDKANGVIEREFNAWSEEVELTELLHTMCMSTAESGEGFGVFSTNEDFESPVKLDFRAVECDQFTAPWPNSDPEMRSTDGIKLDRHGRPKTYSMLKQHPGDLMFAQIPYGKNFLELEAARVVHIFHKTRPGQYRGVPWVTPALGLFALLRRYTLAVVTAAEQAAMIGGAIQTDAPPDGAAANADAFDVVPLDRGTWMTLPAGWKLGQVKAEQPTTTYDMFVLRLLNEACRCLKIPFNLAIGNSSAYNYASGRLDHQAFFKYLRREQKLWVCRVIDRIFRAWLQEAVLIEGYLPQRLRSVEFPKHTWFWDGFEHVDPVKDAKAQETKLKSKITNLAIECAREGRDWQDVMRQSAAEAKLWMQLTGDGLDVDTEKPKVKKEDVDDN